MTPTISQLLQESFDRINKPSAWTTKEYARDSNGNIAAVSSKAATCWCSLGTLYKTAHEHDLDELKLQILEHSLQEAIFIPFTKVTQINDQFGWDIVSAMWRNAIALAKAKEEKQNDPG